MDSKSEWVSSILTPTAMFEFLKNTFKKMKSVAPEQSIPQTLLEACQELAKAYPTGTGGYFHFSGGMAMRNGWGLWRKESPLVQEFIKLTGLFGHGDDISGSIQRGAEALNKGGDAMTAIRDYAEVCRSHWAHSGLDPKTGVQIGPSQTSFTIQIDS